MGISRLPNLFVVMNFFSLVKTVLARVIEDENSEFKILKVFWTTFRQIKSAGVS